LDNLPALNGVHAGPLRRLSITDALRRHPFLTFGTPVVVVALTTLFVLWISPLFQSSASIRIDEEDGPGVAMVQALQVLSAQGSQFQTEVAVLQSRSLAEEVARDEALQVTLVEPARTRRSIIVGGLRPDTTSLETTITLQRTGDGQYQATAAVVHPGNPAEPFARSNTEVRDLGPVTVGVPFDLGGTAGTLQPAAEQHDRIVLHVETFSKAVRGLQEVLVVSRPDREANVASVTYTNTDPELAQSVVNRLTNIYIAKRVGAESTENRTTLAFLRSQLDSLGEELRGAETRLKDFSTASRIVAPDEQAAGQVQRLIELKAERDVVEAERSSLDQLMREVRAEEAQPVGTSGMPRPSPYRRLLVIPAFLTSPGTSQLLTLLTTQESELASKLMLFTPADRDVQLLIQQIEGLESQLRGMSETHLRTLEGRVAFLDTSLAGFEQELTRIPEAQVAYVRLRRETEALAGLHGLLQTRLKEAEIQAGVENEIVRIVDPAIYPQEPIRPRPLFSLFVAVIVGSMLGVVGAVARDQLDRSVRDRQDVGRVTGGAVLGLIPEQRDARLASRLPVHWFTNGREVQPRLLSAVGTEDAVMEAYRSLRANLHFSRIETPPRAVVFTSPMPGDGKSTTAANLALVLAQQGNRVLLVDADMRRGVLHELLGSAREPGLSDVLTGRVPLSQAMTTLEPREGVRLDFVPGGTWPPNPAELITSPAMRVVLSEGLAHHEMVILDAPPLNLVSEAAVLGTYCDGVILVARAGITEESPLEYAVEQLRSVRAPLLGTVLNGVEVGSQDYYGSKSGRAYPYLPKN
jgi:succinoglycan biosynthesis transport protein ExoP